MYLFIYSSRGDIIFCVKFCINGLIWSHEMSLDSAIVVKCRLENKLNAKFYEVMNNAL